jgi:poly(3-hydroxybutyrate) depolymerase
MKRRVITVAVAALACATFAHAEAKVTKETLQSDGQNRTYYLFVPDNSQRQPMPLIVLLHGSGRDGRSLLDPWQPLAKKEGIILAGPESKVREGWGMRDDGPQFMYDLVETIKKNQPVDPKRVYLFGHSAGAIQALLMAVLESEYFAAVAAHAGVLTKDIETFIERAPRKTPIAMWVGTNDKLFPLAPVRATRDLLNAGGFSVDLVEIKGHTHWYYDRAAEINKDVWSFLQLHRLQGEPRYQEYAIPK